MKARQRLHEGGGHRIHTKEVKVRFLRSRPPLWCAFPARSVELYDPTPSGCVGRERGEGSGFNVCPCRSLPRLEHTNRHKHIFLRIENDKKKGRGSGVMSTPSVTTYIHREREREIRRCQSY